MIRFANVEDIDDIMHFIDTEWRKGHILARDRKFFEWMYVKGKNVNFVISKNNSVVDGILGFVSYDENNHQIGLTMWKALKSANGMIGISMLAFVEQELKPQIIASPGVNPNTTTAIYKYFKHDVKKMRHYYRLSKINNFHIGTIKECIIPEYICNGTAVIRSINSFEEYKKENIIFADNAIKKDFWYVKRRYFEHPVFQYFHFIVEKDGKLDVVIREQEVEGHKCLRIVDMLGDYSLLPYFVPEIDKYMVDNNYEYVDCYASSIEIELWMKSGFLDIETTEDIIPNHFAPFERVNIDLYSSCRPHGIVVMRGDGDQDRPN